MSLTFAGLLFVQLTYMKEMVRMRDEQFEEGVKRSLYTVSTDLEQDEAKHFLEEDVARIESSLLPKYNSEGATVGGIKYSFTTGEGLEGDLTIKGNLNALSPLHGISIRDRHRDMQEIIRGQYLYQQSLLNEVILNILSQSSNRPIYERADSARVATYLRNELNNNGLDLPFEFAIVNRMGAVVYKSQGYNQAQASGTRTFVQTLFPNDMRNRMNYLKVYFPSMRNYIYTSIKFMIPSLTFTLILLVTFLLTIILAFRQKKLSEMKNDFINNMTHEFKTPISTISLAAQMLNDSAVLKSPRMLEHISTVINDETKRLRFQVDKVLQMSVLDRQHSTLRIQSVDANDVIQSVAHTFVIKVEKYGGRLETDLQAADSIIDVDEMHFTNAMFNLLDNAVKYRREDTPLQLKVSTRDLSDHRLEITVSDNGIGIRKEHLKKIFDKFYRVSTGNRHDVKGFGLGLAYVSRMIREFGGHINVESEYGQGTKFIIILPLTKN